MNNGISVEKLEEIFNFTSDDIKIKDYFPKEYEQILNNQAIVENLQTFRRKIVLRKKNYPWDWRELAQELDEVLRNTVHSFGSGDKK